MNKEEECTHNWISRRGNNYIKCFNCGYFPSIEKRSQCNICFKEICYLCLKTLFEQEMTTKVSAKTINMELVTEKLDKLEVATELHSLKIRNMEKMILQIENRI